MENFINNLKNIEVEPKSSNWYKLENRLQENNINLKSKRNNTLVYRTIVASVIIIFALSISFILPNNSSLDAKQGFVMEAFNTNSISTVGIYNINQLNNLRKAYNLHQFTTN